MRTAMAARMAAIVLCVSFGCAHTYIASNPDDECGEFSSRSVGIPAFYTPAGQYAEYSGACAQRETVRTIAAARNAAVRGAYVAAAAVRGEGRDAVAREMVARLALQVTCGQGNNSACARLTALDRSAR